MSHNPAPTQQALQLQPNPARVVIRPFRPATEPRDLNPLDKSRANKIVDRVLALPAENVHDQLAEVIASFEGRHRNLLQTFEARADEMEPALAEHAMFGRLQRQLIGAYFLTEYAFEAAALFNPSIVPHPDQMGVAAGECRCVLSLRAVGEGHVSALTFRTCMVAEDGTVSVDPAVNLAAVARVVERRSGPHGDAVDVEFDGDQDISERVVAPVTDAQVNGIEDARFVAFDDAGQTIYHATYTAYSGRTIRSELLTTSDFRRFRMAPLHGSATRNKGMALFPRRIDGRYAMIGRQDNENLFLITSDDLCAWEGGTAILTPKFPWEFVQIGNCGAPIELDEGWLVLTHGVGAVRRYAIGAVLLDKHDPSRVLGRCREPLLRPEPTARGGYVPNVVYTCGGMRHGERVILPYAISDSFTTFATLDIVALVAAMTG